MKCQSLFSGKSEKYHQLSSAEFPIVCHSVNHYINTGDVVCR